MERMADRGRRPRRPAHRQAAARTDGADAWGPTTPGCRAPRPGPRGHGTAPRPPCDGDRRRRICASTVHGAGPARVRRAAVRRRCRPSSIPIGGASGGPLVVLIAACNCWSACGGRGCRASSPGRGPRRSTLAPLRPRRISAMAGAAEPLIRPRMAADPRPSGWRAPSPACCWCCSACCWRCRSPFTNFLFGGWLLLYALALLERDGALMLAARGGTAIVASHGPVLSGRWSRCSLDRPAAVSRNAG